MVVKTLMNGVKTLPHFVLKRLKTLADHRGQFIQCDPLLHHRTCHCTRRTSAVNQRRSNIVHGRHDEAGMVLLAVLVILLVVGGSSASFIWFMDLQQTRAGGRFRSAAAMAAAEAGVQRALSILEASAPDGSPGRIWRPAAFTDRLSTEALEKRFTISLSDGPDGAIIVDSVGEAGGAAMRLRARVVLASPALLAALYGAGVVRLDRPPASTLILSAAKFERQPWVHIAATGGVWFGATDVAVNRGADLPDGARGRIRIVLPPSVDLLLDRDRQRVDAAQLRPFGLPIEDPVRRDPAFFQAPEVDADFYRARAAANAANAELNEAAGKYLGDGNLMRKRDSLYSRHEFEQVQAYLVSVSRAAGAPGTSAAPGPVLGGIVYVAGGMWIRDGQSLRVADGALVAEGMAALGPQASLEITHAAAVRTLPGLILLNGGALTVGRGAHLRAHGVVLVGRVLTIDEGARVEVTGSVLAYASGPSFRNAAGTAVIRYDPAVLGTPGLRVSRGAPAVAWVSAWEELP